MSKQAVHSGEPEPPASLLPLLPRVDDCLRFCADDPELTVLPRIFLGSEVRAFITRLRERVMAGELRSRHDLDSDRILVGLRRFLLHRYQPRFRRVINGTGVIIHTNLGRSILSGEVMDRLMVAGSRYSNLEFDLTTGKRGSRYSLVEELLCLLTGAEAALVVNNNAAAVLIALETLARDREVIVSRGQLVEIGGSFRIPDIMRRSGARLVEVGATNRTHLRDYRQAITEQTGLLLKVHCSNYRIIGFTTEVDNHDLVALGREHGIPVMEDLGSGCLIDLSPYGLMREPTVQDVVASGVDVVTFSGDKLLGGPQAGIIVGCSAIIDRIRTNPLNRALRIDKFTLAGLEGVLRTYLDPERALREIPTLAMIAAPASAIGRRASRLLRRIRALCGEAVVAETVPLSSRVGGGAMPEQSLASRGVRIVPVAISVNALEKRLRARPVAVIGRVENDGFLLDCRTIADDEVGLLAETLAAVVTDSDRP